MPKINIHHAAAGLLWLGSMALSPLAMATTIPSICDADLSNIVTNCGFETGSDSGWTETGNFASIPGFNAISSTVFNSGVNSLRLGNTPGQGVAGLSQTLSTIAGAQYTISFWWADQRPNTGSTGDLPNQLFTASWDGTNLLTLTDQESNFEEYTFTVTGTGADTLAFSGYSNSYWNYVDDVQVDDPPGDPVPEPASLGLFAGALIALRTLRRRQS
jgi:hypothetical protein